MLLSQFGRKWEGEASPGGHAGDTVACVAVRARAAYAVQRQTVHGTGRYHHAFFLCCLFHRRKQSRSDPQVPCPEKLLLGNLPGQMLSPARRELRFFSR